jgi:hypothetical protein
MPADLRDAIRELADLALQLSNYVPHFPAYGGPTMTERRIAEIRSLADQPEPPGVMAVGDLLNGPVIEFYEEPDWYQVSHALGERQPMHRFRHQNCRGGGWSTWRPSGKAWIDRWSKLTGRLVPIDESESDPLTRWGAIPSSQEGAR